MKVRFRDMGEPAPDTDRKSPALRKASDDEGPYALRPGKICPVSAVCSGYYRNDLFEILDMGAMVPLEKSMRFPEKDDTV